MAFIAWASLVRYLSLVARCSYLPSIPLPLMLPLFCLIARHETKYILQDSLLLGSLGRADQVANYYTAL